MTRSIAEFSDFIRLASVLSASNRTEGPVESFQQFVESSSPLVMTAVTKDLDLLARRAKAVADWLTGWCPTISSESLVLPLMKTRIPTFSLGR